jgi:CubicO group peptidase (beta-lactamase class C family)
MTTIAAMQCVERGQISLDDQIASVLPEFKDPDILTGFEDGPIFKKAKTKITLRYVSPLICTRLTR